MNSSNLRVGQIVEYHGTHTCFHGMWFKILSAAEVGNQRRFNLGHLGAKDRRVVLQLARTESLTLIPAKEILTRKCQDFGHEHFYRRGQKPADLTCPLTGGSD